MSRRRGKRISSCISRQGWSFLLVAGALLFFSRGARGQASVAEPSIPSAPAPANPAPASPEMEAFQKARQSVDKFFEQSTNVVCTENVSQAVVGKNGKDDYREDSVFDYQLQSSPTSGSLKLVESRDTRKAAFRDSRSEERRVGKECRCG